MTTTTRIPAAEITGVKGALIRRFAKRTLGRVPSSLGVYWHNQKVLMSMAGVGGKVRKWDACDEQLKSFSHMAVAAQVGCSWCLDFNYFQAHNQHLDLERIELLLPPPLRVTGPHPLPQHRQAPRLDQA